MSRYISGLMLLLLLVNCGRSLEDRHEKINKSKFYNPQPLDKWWRMYKPKLVNSEGWIEENCYAKNKIKIRVKINSQSIKHKSWGRYEGKLLATNLETNEKIYFDYTCFLPNYDKGNWLNNTK